MRRRTAMLVRAAIVAAIGLACLYPSAASAQIAWTQCGESNEIACGHVTVPLDPTGAAPGTIALALRRHRAPIGEARSAIIALAGGPGQPALPFTEQFIEVLGPVAATRDLIVFDQRGTGLSHPLSCHAFEHSAPYHTIGALVSACAGQLGNQRAFFTTDDTVADIEAIRVAGGYEKLVLYGTSYGTKVAERYAQLYPQHVEALVLDSVVAPEGPDPLARSTFQAIPGALRGVCAASACVGVTHEPLADLTRVLARMRRGPLRTSAIDGRGVAHTLGIGPQDLLGLLLAGDLAPVLRAELVTALSAAAHGDTAALARLLGHIEEGGGEGEDFDNPLYYATSCEDARFPWNRAASAHTRLAEAQAVALAQPAGTYAPFTASDALRLGNFEACAGWPFAGPPTPLATQPLPSAPTLILSGSEDLRTPTADARALAASIPGSHLLVVPYTGHSVLGGEPGTCARDAMIALFAGRPIQPCRDRRPPLEQLPPPLPPPDLQALSPLDGAGSRGRTLHAVARALQDLSRQFALELLLGAETAGALRTGGLRAGWAAFSEGRLVLHDYTYVPGVTISGQIGPTGTRLHIGGGAAVPGTLTAAPGAGSLTGSLGGRHVRLPAGALALTAIVPADAHESATRGRLRAARDVSGDARAGGAGSHP